MSGFSIRNPYFIIVVCLMIAVVGTVSLVRLPVDMFPTMNIPVVVVATFYSGMPPEQIETDITSRFERFFTLGSGIEHIESRSLPGVSLIKVYFQPGTDGDAAVNQISNLATANLRLFANLGQVQGLERKIPFLRGARVSFNIDNIFNQRRDVTDATGATPLRNQPGYLDPLGRTVSVSFRKLFFPNFAGNNRPRS